MARDPAADRRRAVQSDLRPSTYARKRARDKRRRDALERAAFDGNQPGEEDWTLPDRSGLKRVPSGPEPVSGAIEDLLRRKGWDDRIESAALFGRWEEVVGQELAQHCRPQRLAGGVLTVSASSPQWATQIRYLSGRIMMNVNQHLGRPDVTEVKVTVGRA